jgi:hypothetical protein
MNIDVREDLKAYIDPLTPEEYEALERSLLAEGCRDALILWGEVLVDGHNRYALCQKHGLPFRTQQHPGLHSIEDVHLWMIDQHLGRRSVSVYQRGVLALRKREILGARRARAREEAGLPPEPSEDTPAAGGLKLASGAGSAAGLPAGATATGTAGAAGPDTPPWADGSTDATAGSTTGSAAGTPATEDDEAAGDALDTRESLARAARLSSAQVAQIEKIQQHATPELLAAVRAGDVSISAAATVATLPAEQQVEAVQGGKVALREAAKKVRDGKRKPKGDKADPADAADPAGDAAQTAAVMAALREQVATLNAENTQLKAEVARLEAQLQQLQG